MNGSFSGAGRGWLAASCALAGVLATGRVEAIPDAGAGYVPKADAPRADVPSQWRWNLSHLFASAEAWEQGYAQLEAALPGLASWKGRLADAAKGVCVPSDQVRCGALRDGAASHLDTFVTGLDQIFGAYEMADRLQVFADADFSTDRTRAEAKARTDRIGALATRLRETGAFVEPELLGMDPATLRALAASSPAHARYAHFVDDLIRRQPHVLSEPQERILALTGDLRAAPYSILNALEEDVVFPKIFDEQGREVALTRANFGKYRASEKRTVRMDTVSKFFGTLRAHARSFAATLDSQVKANVMIAKARNYPSAIAASLDQNAVPVSVYDALIAAVHERLPATLHRYVALRKRMLGVDRLHYYDLYNPLFPDARQSVPYPEAVKLVTSALAPLGPEYGRVLAAGMDPKNGWVDVYPNQGKRGGAYCNAAYRNHPIVFLNYMDELDDVFTLAHEYGHALNFHLTHVAQDYVNSFTSIFLAEIASTFNEELLLDSLLTDAKGRQERLALLNKRVENIRTTVFRQVLFAEFERAIHAEIESGGALTAERLSAIYGKLVQTYYGPDYVLDPDDAYEWAYIPHFYYNFYVYQYATGLMSAVALATRVARGDKGVAAAYVDFLKTGNSDYPLALLKKVGVDLTRPDDMKATLDLFAATLDEIERIR